MVDQPDEAVLIAEFGHAVALHQQGRLAEAEQIYRAVLQRQPAHFDALHLLGVLAMQRRQPVQAAELIDRAITLNPDSAEARNNRGAVLAELGRTEEALSSYDTAILLKPDYAEPHYNRGRLLAASGHSEAALAGYDRAIALKPDYVEAHNNRGNALRSLGRFAEALASFDRAIALRPDHAGAHNNRGAVLADLGRPEEALASCNKAVSLTADQAEMHNNRGVVLADLGHPDQALASYDRAIALQPDYAEAYNNRGNVLLELQRPDAALASFEAAIALKSGSAPLAAKGSAGVPQDGLIYAGAHWNLSTCRLSLGDYETGWALYEWRWQAVAVSGKREFRQPRWLGDFPIEGRTILVHAEQGFGDSLQFCRYVPMLAKLATVILEVPPPLLRLFASLRGVARVVATGDALPEFDAWIPMMSLPLAFRTTLATVPAEVPYLFADPDQSEDWRRRLAGLPGFRVGLVWAGSPQHDDARRRAMDRRRSVTLQHFAPLAAIPGLCLISLQKGEAAAQAAAPPQGMALHDWTGELADFADTAALIQQLDLVVSVDTAVAHLAGALGKPVWVLNRYDQCWRWLRNRTDSPWYPTARLFQQRAPGDWTDVIGAVAAELRNLMPPPTAPAAAFEHALELQRQGRLAEAEAAALSLLRQHPEHWGALHLLGIIALRTGRPQLAEQQIGQAISLNPEVAEAHNAYGAALAELGHPEAALACYDQAIALKPAYAEAYYNRARALMALGRPADALSDYDRAIAHNPCYAEAYNNRGNALRKLGRLEEAVPDYEQAIALDPDHARAHNNRGVALTILGQSDEALSSYDKAIALQPDYADAYANRGGILRMLERPADALTSYEKLLALKPDDAESHNSRGAALADMRLLTEALACFDRAIALDPGFAEAYSNRGTALTEMQRPADAIASFDQAIALNPGYAEAFNNRGNALRDLKNPAAALASFDRAIALQSDYAEAYSNRGAALADLGRFDDALASYDRAIALRPDLATTYSNRGVALADMGRLTQALSSYATAIALQPDYAEAYTNRGNALRDLGRFDAALSDHDRAIALRPDYVGAHNNRGVALADLGRPAEALASYAKAIALQPDDPSANWNQSMCLLSLGDYAAGWPMFEWRWKSVLASGKRDLPGPLWLGDFPIAGRTILVHAEQGFGDSLQFCRYVPMLAAFASVVVELPKPLLRLLGRLPGVSRVVAMGDPLPAFDAWTPMMSLPLAFRTTVETIPAGVPYLHADAEQSRAWHDRLAALPGRKVGLVWAGSPRHEDPRTNSIDRRRSITLDHYAELAAIPGLHLVSLQKGEAAAQARNPPPGMALHDWTEELDDFADTAALVENLDLVITVDSAVAHLAGALGRPVWVLNRFDQCWRWLRDRTDSPWYPTARLFQQSSPGDWSGVIHAVTEALRAATSTGID